MPRIRAFRALRPRPDDAAGVAAVPYDVVSTEEARTLARGNPRSFLRVTRPEIDLPEDMDPHGPEAHARGREALDHLVTEGVLVEDAEPGIFLYRLVRDGRSQVGVACVVRVDDYRSGAVRRHELTHRAKEDDRMRHTLALGVQPGPVLLAHRDDPRIEELAAADMARPPLYDFVASDGVRHTVWRTRHAEPYVEALARHEAIYIADGHHRSASAMRAADALRARYPDAPEDAPFEYFLAVIFPAGALTILPYHRLVRELGGLSPEDFLERVRAWGTVEAGGDPSAVEPGSCALYVAGTWHTLRLPPAADGTADVVRSLDYARVQRHLLDEILGIRDPRSDPRVVCVGGIRGVRELEHRVDRGDAALAVAMPATPMEQVLQVADAGAILPPKSTWFEPKLRSGLLVHRIDPGGS
jgi:uncharacterized protein (DUF1015 family)